MKKTIILIAAVAALLCGCSHNQGTLIAGKGFIIGADGIKYFNGVTLLDNSRENSSWKVELTEDDALKEADGAAKSVRVIERTVGRQVTGYLVELSGKDPEAAREYLKKDTEGAK